MSAMTTYVDSKIGMKECLELPILISCVPDCETRLQVLSIQGDGVCDAELVTLPFRRDTLKHVIRETKVKFNRSIAIVHWGGR